MVSRTCCKMWEDHLEGNFLEGSVAFPFFLFHMAVDKFVGSRRFWVRSVEFYVRFDGILGDIYVVMNCEARNFLLPLLHLSWI